MPRAQEGVLWPLGEEAGAPACGPLRTPESRVRRCGPHGQVSSPGVSPVGTPFPGQGPGPDVRLAPSPNLPFLLFPGRKASVASVWLRLPGPQVALGTTVLSLLSILPRGRSGAGRGLGRLNGTHGPSFLPPAPGPWPSSSCLIFPPSHPSSPSRPLPLTYPAPAELQALGQRGSGRWAAQPFPTWAQSKGRGVNLGAHCRGPWVCMGGPPWLISWTRAAWPLLPGAGGGRGGAGSCPGKISAQSLHVCPLGQLVGGTLVS